VVSQSVSAGIQNGNRYYPDNLSLNLEQSKKRQHARK